MNWKIFIGNNECDPPEDFSIEFEYSVADLSNLNTRQGSQLKDFILPFTDRNRVALGFSENVESGSKINQNSLVKIRIDSGGDELQGYAKIQTISDGYSITVLQDNAELLTIIKDLQLSDLDFSAYTHVLNITNILASWTATGGIYDGTFVYDYIDRGGGQKTINDIYPAIKMFSILTKIINEAGFNLVSSFALSAYFQKKYLGFSNEALIISDALVTSATAYGQITGSSGDYYINVGEAISNWGRRLAIDYAAIPENIIGSNITGSQYLYSQPIGSFNDTFTFGTTVQATISLKFRIVRATAFGSCDFLIFLNRNNNQLDVSAVSFNDSTDYQDVIIEVPLFTIYTSDEIIITLRMLNLSNTPSYFTNKFYIDKDTSVFKILPINTCVEGASVDLSLNLPNLSQIDFIKLCKELFNLYFFTDINTRTMYIEPMDDFYKDSSTALDWSKKVDLNQIIEIEYFDEQNKLQFDFKIDEKDNTYKYFKQYYKPIYGDVTIDLQNKYSTNTKVIGNSIASGSAYVDCPNMGMFQNKLIRIWGENGSAEKTLGHNIRVWDYEGYTAHAGTDMTVFVYNEGNDIAQITSYPKFIPLFWRNITIDGVQKEGLFMKFYKNLSSIIDNGEKRTFPVYLDFSDIINYNPRKLIWIDIPEYGGSYYILNKLTGTITENQTCLAELIPYAGKQNSYVDKYTGSIPILYPANTGSNNLARAGVRLEYNDNGDIVINNNGAPVMRINSSTGEIQTTGKQIYCEHPSLKLIYTVLITGDDGRIRPVLVI